MAGQAPRGRPYAKGSLRGIHKRATIAYPTPVGKPLHTVRVLDADSGMADR